MKGGRHLDMIRYFNPNRSTAMTFSNSIRTFATSTLAAATLTMMLLPTPAQASIFSHKKAADASLGGTAQTVSFNVANRSGADIELRAGDQFMTVAKGQTLPVKLAVGTRITTTTASDKREAGSIICEVSNTLKGNTVVLN
jgi:hypothetical protein